jgi:hypothetical protein
MKQQKIILPQGFEYDLFLSIHPGGYSPAAEKMICNFQNKPYKEKKVLPQIITLTHA